MKIYNKNSWFTFVEILLSTVISVTILIFTFSFLADTMDNLASSDKKSKILVSFYDIVNSINNYKNVYLTWSILINNLAASWSDILVLKDTNWSAWVVFWVVDRNSMKLESWALFNNYNYKIFAYKEISSGQLTTITWTPTEVYKLDFTNDHLFSFPVKLFQAEYFNTWSVLDIKLDVLVNYNSWFSGQLWNNIPNTAYELYKINLDF